MFKKQLNAYVRPICLIKEFWTSIYIMTLSLCMSMFKLDNTEAAENV